MIARDCVFNPRQYVGDIAPAVGIEDMSRYNYPLIFGAAGAAPNSRG